ncbi:MAG TPA: SHOCT domain-containing protein [Chloroflexota bacterium]|nr:SHOCT domain-containing protein [Chloroflexota bacterium]
MADLASELERLGALRNSGVLTDEQFEAAKAQVLGAIVPPPQATIAQQAGTTGPPAPQLPTCPSCHQSDKVQRLSARLRIETQYGDFSEVLAGSTTPEPNWCPWDIERTVPHRAIFGFSYSGTTSAPTALHPPAIPEISATRVPSAVKATAGGAAAAVAASFVFGPAAPWAYKRVKKKMAAVHEAPTALVDDMAWVEWQMAAQKWDNLFYCGRCDGVFLPNDYSDLVASGKTQEFIRSTYVAGERRCRQCNRWAPKASAQCPHCGAIGM